MRGATILASLLMQGFFYVQESKGDLTRDHYLNSPPIEPSLKEFSHTRKDPRWSGRDSNLRLRAQRQARSPLSHPTTLFVNVADVHNEGDRPSTWCDCIAG